MYNGVRPRGEGIIHCEESCSFDLSIVNCPCLSGPTKLRMWVMFLVVTYRNNSSNIKYIGLHPYMRNGYIYLNETALEFIEVFPKCFHRIP